MAQGIEVVVQAGVVIMVEVVETEVVLVVVEVIEDASNGSGMRESGLT